MKRSQFITIFILLVVATVLIVVGSIGGKNPKDATDDSESVVKATLKPIEIPDETAAPESDTPTETPSDGTVDPNATPAPTSTPELQEIEFPTIRNADFTKYSNDFDNFSTAWIDKTATASATGYITSGTLERLKDIDYVYYTNVDSTESWDIFVTFSMHYEYGYTVKTLDLLREKGVKAVFFVSAEYIKENPEIVKQIVEEGHLLGNRPYITESAMKAMTPEQFAAKLLEVEKEYRKLFGEDKRMYLFRTDFFSNRILHVAEAMGYTVVFRTYTFYQTYGAYGENISVEDLAKRFNERGLYKGSVDEFSCEEKVYKALGTFLQYGLDEEVSFKLVERKR